MNDSAAGVVIPIFPLGTILFPGGILPLRIFEKRYLDMVRQCMRDESPFGVVSISSGQEVGEVARTYDVGTTADIVNWDMQPGGLLHIEAKGRQRFRLLRTEVQPDKLLVGEIELMAPVASGPLAAEHAHMAALLREVLPRISDHYDLDETRLADKAWVSARCAEVLPIEAARKQSLLELDNVDEQLRLIEHAIEELRRSQA